MTPEMKLALQNFRTCNEDAPEGTYEDAKALGSVIGESCDTLIKDIRSLGLKADSCDLIFAVEAAIYDYAKQSNPDNPMFPTAEGFGMAMGTESRERVIANAISSRDFMSAFLKVS